MSVAKLYNIEQRLSLPRSTDGVDVVDPVARYRAGTNAAASGTENKKTTRTALLNIFPNLL